MININFDKLLFVLSADALVRFALPGLDEISLEKIRDIARTEIDRFMDGGSNYYMEVDFSEGRKSETARDFLLAVRALKNGSLIADEISSLAASNAVATGGYHNARSKLRSIAARFCYLKTEDLLVIPTPYLQEIALNLEVHDLNPLYFDFSSTLQAIESAEPASPWDKRVLGPELFDGIDGVVRLAAKEMVEGGAAVRFLQGWRNFLPSGQFVDVIQYLAEEARAELADSNGVELGIVLNMLKFSRE